MLAFLPLPAEATTASTAQENNYP